MMNFYPLLCIASALMISQRLMADGFVWSSSKDDNYRDASHWLPQDCPAEGDDVVINNGTKVDYHIEVAQQYAAGADFTVGSEGSLLVSGVGSEWFTDESNWSYVAGTLVVKRSGAFRRATKSGNLVFGADAYREGYQDTEIVLDKGEVSSDSEVWFGLDDGTKTHTKMTLNHGGKFSALGGDGAAIFVWENSILELNFEGDGSIEVGTAGLKYGGKGPEALEAGRFENLWKRGLLTYKGNNDGEFDDYFTVSGTNGKSLYTLTSKKQPIDDSNLGSALISIGNVKIILRE